MMLGLVEIISVPLVHGLKDLKEKQGVFGIHLSSKWDYYKV